jgi:hypothetical protein
MTYAPAPSPCTTCDNVERYLYRADGSVERVPEHVPLYEPLPGLASGPMQRSYSAPAAGWAADDFNPGGYGSRMGAPLSAAGPPGFATSGFSAVGPRPASFVTDPMVAYGPSGGPVQRVVRRVAGPMSPNSIPGVYGTGGAVSRGYPQDAVVGARMSLSGATLIGQAPPSIGPLGGYASGYDAGYGQPARVLSNTAAPYPAALSGGYAYDSGSAPPPQRYDAAQRLGGYGPQPFPGSFDYYGDYTVGSLGVAGPAAGIATTTYTAGGPNPHLPQGSRYGRYPTPSYGGGYAPSYAPAGYGLSGYAVGSAPTYVDTTDGMRGARSFPVPAGGRSLSSAYGGPMTYQPTYNDVVYEDGGYGAPGGAVGPRIVSPPEFSYY